MGTPKGFSKLTYATSLLLITALVGCSNGPEEGEGESTTSNLTGYGYSSMASGYKVLIEEATVEDLIPHKVACPSQKKGKHQEQICVQICHVPPGNPENSHDKVLPLAAIQAHLGHGDYLGLCGAANSEPIGSSDDTSSEDPSSGDGPTGGSLSGEDSEPLPEPDPVVPNFCEPYYEVDQDCDGFNDSTGIPYL